MIDSDCHTADCRASGGDDLRQCSKLEQGPKQEQEVLVPQEEVRRGSRFTAAASLLFGIVSLAVWWPVIFGTAGGFIPWTLITPLIGYGLGKGGTRSRWQSAARVGITLNSLAVLIALGYIILRASRGESILWLEP